MPDLSKDANDALAAIREFGPLTTEAVLVGWHLPPERGLLALFTLVRRRKIDLEERGWYLRECDEEFVR